MQIVVTGVNHASAPLNVRERLFLPETRLAEELSAIRDSVDECILLSTCNRTELYVRSAHESTGAELIRGWMVRCGGLSRAELERYTYVHAHEHAVQHAFRVASGLDSMVVGEEQILGQMRRAIAAARAAGTLGPLLDRLGSSALGCGKRVQTEISPGARNPSVVSVAIDAGVRAGARLAGGNALVIGSGETATLALAALLEGSLARITVVNRTEESAAALALEYGVESATWQDLARLLSEADIVVSCTSAPRPVLDAGLVRAARQASPTRTTVLLDLGVPRDVDPRVEGIDGVRLIDMDAIGTAAGVVRIDRRRQLEAAQEIVLDEVERFMSWWRERDVVPAITKLHEHARHLERLEVERALARLPELSERERDVVRSLAARLTSKLLHDPTVALKRDPEGPNMAMMLDRLFRFDEARVARSAGRDASAEREETPKP